MTVFCAPAARSCESVEGFCAPAGVQNPSTLSQNRLACEPSQVKKRLLRSYAAAGFVYYHRGECERTSTTEHFAWAAKDGTGNKCVDRLERLDEFGSLLHV